jgi:hypothetical protein
MTGKPQAMGLFSGGLDSRLAFALLSAQGLRLGCVHFRTGFVKDDRRAEVRRLQDDAGPAMLQVVDVARDYLREVVLNPRYGYGSAMNPCLDCRIFMLRRAGGLAREAGCDLLFTGDVVGQRSMEQSRGALLRIDREAEMEGRVLRPLSALLLPETAAERRGEVRRAGMRRLHGRTRRGQLDLARELGVSPEPTPSGGCCWLADRGFARRLRDLLAHRGEECPDSAAIALLSRGRHFRPAWNLKVILGRNEEESTWLAGRARGRWTCQVASGRGTLGILEGEPDDAGYTAAATLAARYSRERGERRVEVLFRRGEEHRRLEVAPAPQERIERWRV